VGAFSYKISIAPSGETTGFVDVHLCSSFPIDPQNFSGGSNFYQKIPFLAILGGGKATFLKL